MGRPIDRHEAHDVPPRRFTLADAMLLVAAAALSLMMLKYAAGLGLFAADPTSKSPPGREFIEHLSIVGGCILFPLALLVVALSLGHRRPSRREVIRGPGFVACLAVMMSAIHPIAFFAIRMATARGPNYLIDLQINYNNVFGRLKSGAAPMIFGAWLALALDGRRPIWASWIDRLGCLVGLGFILMNIHSEMYFLLQPLLFR